MHMKTIKYNVSWMMVLCITAGLQAQTMRWTPVNTPAKYGKCSFVEDKEGKTQCYVLEYVPAVSGVLTSYTTGFLCPVHHWGQPFQKINPVRCHRISDCSMDAVQSDRS